VENANNAPGRRHLTREEVRALALRPVHAALHAAVYWLVQQLLNGNF
jgi:hypothetical protein